MMHITPRLRWFVVMQCLLTGCGLEGPQPGSAHLLGLARPGAISTVEPFSLLFSAALSAASVGPEVVALVARVDAGPCEYQAQCREGACLYGRCQVSALSAAFIADFRSGALNTKHRSLSTALEVGAAGAQLNIRPLAPLRPGWLYEVIVSAQLRDAAQLGLRRDGDGVAGQLSVVTSEVSGASVRLLSPAADQDAVPANLQRVVLDISVALGPEVALALVSEEDERVVLMPADEAPTAGARSWQVVAPLPVGRRWRVDARCRTAEACRLPLVYEQSFVSVEEDRVAPSWRLGRFWVADGCVQLELAADEPVDVLLQIGEQLHRWPLGQRHYLRGVGLPLPFAGMLELGVSDLAGNHGKTERLPLALTAPPLITISEVMANPQGREPEQEYVELFNRGEIPLQLADWTIDDADDGAGVVTLPPLVLRAGGRVVVAGEGFNPAEAGVVTHAALLVVKGRLGMGGLSNRGERIVLRDPAGVLVSSYGGYVDQRRAGDDGRSVERIDEGGCDTPQNWAQGPVGGSAGATRAP